MTPDQLRDLLRKLAAHLATLHEDLEEAGWHAARTSQTGVRTGTTGSKPPCDTIALDYIITDVSPRVKGWCHNLREDTGLAGIPLNQPLNHWAAWLSRHRETLLEMPWADDAVEELVKLEEELRHRIHPTDPNQIALMASIAKDRKDTARNVARMLSASMGKRVDRNKVMYLAKSGRVGTYPGPDGETHYSLVEVRDALEDWQDKRVKNDE